MLNTMFDEKEKIEKKKLKNNFKTD